MSKNSTKEVIAKGEINVIYTTIVDENIRWMMKTWILSTREVNRNVWQVNLWIFAKGNNLEYGTVSCIYECTTHIKIECEITSNKNRGLKMNRSGTSFQYLYVVKIWQIGREYFESKACMKSYYLVYSQPSSNFEDKIFIRR